MGSSPPDTPPPRSRWVVPALLPLLVMAAFSSALSGGFQYWDDAVLLVDNSAYRGLGWSNLRWMFTTNLMGHYMPVTWMSYGLDHVLWGPRPVGFHLTSILLHAANVMLVYALALRLYRIAWPHAEGDGGVRLRIGAALGALLFGVHPLRVESVAWVTERRDVLCGLFYLLAVLLYLRAVDGEPGTRRRSGPVYWAALGVFVLALLSKSMAVTLPAVLLLLDIYPLRRLRPGLHGWLTPGPWPIWREKLPFLLAAAAVSAAAFRALVGGAAATSWERLGLLDRVAISLYSVAFYLWKTLLPVGLSPLYELPVPFRVADRRFLVAGLVVLLVTAVAVAVRRRWPALLAVWVGYVLMLLPVVGIVHNGYQIAADRYTYLPGVGWALLAGGVTVAALRRLQDVRGGGREPVVGAAVLVSLIAAVLMLTTWAQAAVWRDDETLWRHAIRLDPRSSIAASNLGAALRAAGRLDEAVEYSRRALELRPDLPPAHVNLGLARARQGRLVEAEGHFRRALELRPRSIPAHAGLGSVLEARGRLAEALEHLRAAVEIDPQSARAHNDLGVALARNGKVREALVEFSDAVRIDPGFAEAQNNLGLALAQTGRLTEAADHFRVALRSRGDFPDARRNLELTLRLLGR